VIRKNVWNVLHGYRPVIFLTVRHVWANYSIMLHQTLWRHNTKTDVSLFFLNMAYIYIHQAFDKKFSQQTNCMWIITACGELFHSHCTALHWISCESVPDCSMPCGSHLAHSRWTDVCGSQQHCGQRGHEAMHPPVFPSPEAPMSLCLHHSRSPLTRTNHCQDKKCSLFVAIFHTTHAQHQNWH